MIRHSLATRSTFFRTPYMERIKAYGGNKLEIVEEDETCKNCHEIFAIKRQTGKFYCFTCWHEMIEDQAQKWGENFYGHDTRSSEMY